MLRGHDFLKVAEYDEVAKSRKRCEVILGCGARKVAKPGNLTLRNSRVAKAEKLRIHTIPFRTRDEIGLCAYKGQFLIRAKDAHLQIFLLRLLLFRPLWEVLELMVLPLENRMIRIYLKKTEKSMKKMNFPVCEIQEGRQNCFCKK